MQKLTLNSLLPLVAATLGTLLLAGCSASFTPDATLTGQTAIGNIQGTVRGGQSPISGAEIFLFAAGTTGYPTATSNVSVSLLTSATGHQDTSGTVFNGDWYVTTDAGGNFSVGGDYTCTPGTQVYLVAYGGDPGLTPTTTFNPYIVQMAGLGECPQAGNLAATVPQVVINEISTVVFAYAMGGFGTSATNIGIPANDSLAQTGIRNAMNNVSNILNIAYGQSPTATNANPNGIVPQTKIYTLADILAECVNSPGTLVISTKTKGKTTYTDQPCYYLFNYTTGTKGGMDTPTATGDEAQAIFYMVHNPTTNVKNLFGIQSADNAPAFLPRLSTTQQPTDFTLPIIYSNAVSTFGTSDIDGTSTTTSGPFNIAFDASGTAWIGDRVRGVVEMSPQGVVSTHNDSFGMIKGVTVAANGNIWAVDYGSNALYVMDGAGGVDSKITTGLNGPVAVAFDSSGNAFVANETGVSISVYDQLGNILSNQTAIPNIDTPGFISVDANGYAWVPSTDTAYVGELLPPGIKVKGKTQTTYTASSLEAEAGYAVIPDAADNLWYGDYTDSLLGVTTNTNTGKGKNETQTNSGLNGPYHLAVDGSGTIWIANEGAANVSEWNPTTNNGAGKWVGAGNGFTTGVATTNPVTGNVAVVPDLSGNLWIANTDGSVTQLLGLATPTVAPLTPANVGTEP